MKIATFVSSISIGRFFRTVTQQRIVQFLWQSWNRYIKHCFTDCEAKKFTVRHYRWSISNTVNDKTYVLSTMHREANRSVFCAVRDFILNTARIVHCIFFVWAPSDSSYVPLKDTIHKRPLINPIFKCTPMPPDITW